jgi:hypothetical protein
MVWAILGGSRNFPDNNQFERWFSRTLKPKITHPKIKK